MDNNILRRRVHVNYPNDLAIAAPSTLPGLTSPFPIPVDYPLSPSSAIPQDQAGNYSTSVCFASPQSLVSPSLGGQYQHQEIFQHPADYSSHYHSNIAPNDHSYHSEQPLKRQRLEEEEMRFPFIPQTSVNYDDKQRASKVDLPYHDLDRGAGGAFTIAECFSICAPATSFEEPPAYDPLVSGPMYETPARTFSEIRVPNLSDMAHPQEFVTPSLDQTQLLIHLDQDPVSARQLQAQYPPMQPVMHNHTMPSYIQHDRTSECQPSQIKAESDVLKVEDREQDFYLGAFPTFPGYNNKHEHSHNSALHPESRIYAEQCLTRPQAQSQRFITQPYMPPGSMTYEQFDVYQLAPEDEVPRHTKSQKPQTTKRGPFKDQNKREKTAQTRKIGSCIRCRMQRIRCEFDPDAPDDENAPCDGCKKIVANSKIHRLPCRRWKLVDVRLSKSGNVEWTYRWKDSNSLPEINKWQDTTDREVNLNDGFTELIRVRLRQFKVMDGDQKTRKAFNYHTGTTDEIEMKPFALVDVADTKLQYERYLTESQDHIFKRLLGDREKLLWKTYRMAQKRRDRPGPEVTDVERDLLSMTLRLWVAVRLTTRSFEIAGEGKTALGQRPDSKGRILLHPVFGQQLDKVLLDHVLPKLRRQTLDCLQNITQSKKPHTWLTTYLVSFILLHNVALITRHDKDRAEKHGASADKKPLAIWHRADNVKKYHLGANIFLAYFHYCNKGVYPFSDECKPSDLQTLAKLDEEGIEFVEWTRQQVGLYKYHWDCLKDEGLVIPVDDNADEHVQLAKAYSDDYFFVSQLFEKNWEPRETTVDKNARRKFGPVRKTDRQRKRHRDETTIPNMV